MLACSTHPAATVRSHKSRCSRRLREQRVCYGFYFIFACPFAAALDPLSPQFVGYIPCARGFRASFSVIDPRRVGLLRRIFQRGLFKLAQLVRVVHLVPEIHKGAPLRERDKPFKCWSISSQELSSQSIILFSSSGFRRQSIIIYS